MINQLSGTAKTAGWYYRTAFEALLKIRPDPLLVLEHINDSTDWDTKAGLETVRDLDPTRTGALVHAVRTCDARKRFFAAELLGEMGPAAAEVVPALLEVLRSESRNIVAQATAWSSALGVVWVRTKPFDGKLLPCRT